MVGRPRHPELTGQSVNAEKLGCGGNGCWKVERLVTGPSRKYIMAENGKTAVGSECQPEEFVRFLIELCIYRQETQPHLTMNLKKRNTIRKTNQQPVGNNEA